MEILIYLDILMLSGNIRVCGSILVLRSRSKCNYAVLLQSSAILRLRREKLGKFEKLKPKDVFFMTPRYSQLQSTSCLLINRLLVAGSDT